MPLIFQGFRKCQFHQSCSGDPEEIGLFLLLFFTVDSHLSISRGMGQGSERSLCKRETERNVCKNPLGRKITKCQTILVWMCWETQNINGIITRLFVYFILGTSLPLFMLIFDLWKVRAGDTDVEFFCCSDFGLENHCANWQMNTSESDCPRETHFYLSRPITSLRCII